MLFALHTSIAVFLLALAVGLFCAYLLDIKADRAWARGSWGIYMQLRRRCKFAWILVFAFLVCASVLNLVAMVVSK